MKIIPELLTILSFLVSCKDNSQQSANCPVYNIKEGFSRNSDVDSIVINDSIFYIQTEKVPGITYDPHSFIQSINDTVFIFEPKFKKFFAYDFNGRFLFKIGKYGKNSSEVINILDFTIDSKENHIFAYEYLEKKVVCFSTAGEYLYDFDYNNMFVKMIYKDYGLFLFNPRPSQCLSDSYVVTKINLNGKVLEQFRKIEGESLDGSCVLFNTIYLLNDTLCFWDCYSDTVFQIVDDKLMPRFVMDLGKNIIPIDILKIKTNFYSSFKNYDNINNFFENNDYLFLYGNSKERVKLILFNKNTNNATNCLTNSDLGSITTLGKTLYPFFPTHQSNNMLIQVINPNRNQIEENQTIKQNQSNTKFDYNPLIAIMK
jgi:hypothetical protein